MGQIVGNSTTDDGAVGTSTATGKSGVFGFNSSANSNGVAGICDAGNGVYGSSKNSNGVYGHSETGSGIHGHSITQIGIYGDSEQGDAIVGVSKSSSKCGVFGSNESMDNASSPGGSGVFGLTLAEKAAGVFGANNNPKSGRGVQGNGTEAGVGGFSENGIGVIGQSNNGDGAQGFTGTSSRNGILGKNNSVEHAPAGTAPCGNGIFGYTDVPNASGVCGAVGDNNTEGAGITGIGKMAGRFFGDVHVTGNLTSDSDIFLTNADFAEDFDIVGEACDAGTVMILAPNGGLEGSTKAYDKKVAGILSGAGSYKPGIVLDRHAGKKGRQPLAMVGKVFCKVDADVMAIEIGDLLTTSDIPGHAMKAVDPVKAFGTVIGKALQPLDKGKGMIAVLVSLQ